MKPRRAAFTLIEIIVGLVLMGSLVAAALVALSTHQRAILLANRKQQANQIAESLLANWYELQNEIPTREQGIVHANGVWLWRTQPVGLRSVCGLPVNIIRFQVMGQVGARVEPQVLVSIELLQGQNAATIQ